MEILLFFSEFFRFCFCLHFSVFPLIYSSFSPSPTGSSQSPDHSKTQASPETPQQPVSIPFSQESTPSSRSI
ncbi:hypothetical protein EDB83DRAFT_2329283, partial [Lactarius deliciosus]